MIRSAFFVLCLILMAAAAGRYQAEVEVREIREEINSLDSAYKQEARQVQLLRAEIAYLESPERLARIAKKTSGLRPPSSRQIATIDDLANVFAGADAPSAERRAADPATIALIDLPTE